VIAESHPAGSRFAIPYRYYGSLLVGGALVPLSFFDLHSFLRGHDLRLIGPSVLLTVAALVVMLLTRQVAVSGTGPQIIPSRQQIPLGLSLLMVVLPLLGVLTRSGLVPTLLVNGAMVAGAFWLMQVGLREDRGRPFSAGVLYFLLWSVLRYIDLFGDVGGMVGAAVMFFACGAALFAVGRYWQGRKEVRYA
jgi:hypothetical protein